MKWHLNISNLCGSHQRNLYGGHHMHDLFHLMFSIWHQSASVIISNNYNI